MKKMIPSNIKHETKNTKVNKFLPKGGAQRNKRMLVLFIQ